MPEEDKAGLTKVGNFNPLVLVEPRWFSISARGNGTRSLEIVNLEEGETRVSDLAGAKCVL